MQQRNRLHILLLACCLAGCKPAPSVSPPAPASSPPAAATVQTAANSSSAESHLQDTIAGEANQMPAAEPDEATKPSEDETPFTLEPGFTALSLSDFEAFSAEPETWTATDDGFRSSGKPKGYLYSLDPHQNFTWRLEYRFDRPKSLTDDSKFKGNTGFLVYINGEHKFWPLCLEVQGKHVQMGAIKENGGAAAVTVQDDDAGRQAARKPVGEWNELEIHSRDGAISVKLNGVPISRSEPNFLSEGKIGVQAEDHPFAVRRMRIRDE